MRDDANLPVFGFCGSVLFVLTGFLHLFVLHRIGQLDIGQLDIKTKF